MNRYLQDNFAPVHDELTAFDLEVTGRIPDHLDGRYLRIGPNPATDPGAGYHWFLGEGMVHGVRLGDGRAQWYRNRYVQPQGDDFPPNTNVFEHSGRTLAVVEAGGVPYELTHNLDTVGPCDLGTVTGGYTAHPHEDPATGELHAISYNWARGNLVDYSVVGLDGRVREQVEIEVTGSPMIHDCAITERYLVVYDLPVTFDLGMVAGEAPRPLQATDRLIDAALRTGTPSRLPYSWDADYPARIGLLPRDGSGGGVRWFEIDQCYVFHTLNAYEDGTDVVIDVVRHDRMFATDFTGPNEGPAYLTRFTIDTVAGTVREHRFDEHSQEFPRYDERLTGRRHRFGYAAGVVAAGVRTGDSVLKHDVVAGTTTSRSLGAGREVSEFCFVPSAPDSAEDEGVLMGYVYDLAVDRSSLVLLDAETLEDVAAVHLPGRVPAGFHGNWAPTGG
ncbi:carotenoid oxygenase family protein [Nocardioides sp. CN2-186]|uniref:carotenoid oxygenase family protein n=1 Tax=Nocardioides tweenelious TaxID=3156607 RepID=UPI0032B39E6C